MNQSHPTRHFRISAWRATSIECRSWAQWNRLTRHSVNTGLRSARTQTKLDLSFPSISCLCLWLPVGAVSTRVTDCSLVGEKGKTSYWSGSNAFNNSGAQSRKQNHSPGGWEQRAPRQRTCWKHLQHLLTNTGHVSATKIFSIGYFFNRHCNTNDRKPSRVQL